MTSTISSLAVLAGQNQFLSYLAIYVATIFIGNISAFAGFWVVLQGRFGDLGIPILIGTIFTADLTGDLLWYSLGHSLRDTKQGNWIKNHLPYHKKIETYIQKTGAKWIFFSKFIYASTFPLIFSIGWSKMEFKKFIKVSLLSIVCWLPILLGLAYGLVSGLSTLQTVALFKRFELVFITGIALFILINYLLIRAFKRIFGENGNAN